VVVFFLVSGWLVGGSLLNKLGQPQAVRSYAIDRITRLWTVLLPAMLLMVGIGVVTGALDPAQPGFRADYSPLTLLGNLLGLQTVLVKNFADNYSLWSLANETWYYIAFPLVLFAFRGPGFLRQTASVAALAMIAALMPWAITLYFALWLLGVAFSRIRIECGNGTRIALVALAGCLSIYYRFRGSNDDLVPASFLQDLSCSLPLLLLLSALQMKIGPADKKLRKLGKLANFFSDFSFTLYVSHVPAIALLRHIGRTVLGRDQLAPDRPLDYAIYAGMILFIVSAAYLSYLLFESQTYRIRRKLKQTLVQQPAKPAREPAVAPK
jgi:peptidoglycan/LPS O-acetylase OafA/YrhL